MELLVCGPQPATRYRHLLERFEQADSWATDGHKWLNVPYGCGYAFVAHPASHRAAMSHRAPYLTHDQDARDQIDWNPEWSRRARGFATYAALRQLVRQGLDQMVDRCCRHARDLVTGLGSYRVQKYSGSRLPDGRAFFMGTAWRHQRAMRVSVLNWQTTRAGIATAVDAVAKCLGR